MSNASKTNTSVLAAVLIVIAYHGALAFFTASRTYDAYVHIFFADHYARSWFEPWETRWYGGFTMTSYPPGVHQSIALLSQFTGLETAFVIVTVAGLCLLVTGIYRYSRIFVSDRAAGYASLLAVFSPSIAEVVHVFGQVPTILSLALLLHVIPSAERWVRIGGGRNLAYALVGSAGVVAVHHVTVIFGALFFLGPVIAELLLESLRNGSLLPESLRSAGPTSANAPDSRAEATIVHSRRAPLWASRSGSFDAPLSERQPPRPSLFASLPPSVRDGMTSASLRVRAVSQRLRPRFLRALAYGIPLLVLVVVIVFPYWVWTKSDPITQVPIPHASRDSFIKNPAAGLVFFLVPYALSIPLLPYIAYRFFRAKRFAFGLSFCLLVLLGTGGTTPLPRLLLGRAFSILTMDRFTFWATIMLLPVLGEIVAEAIDGPLAAMVRVRFGVLVQRASVVLAGAAYVAVAIILPNLTQFRPFQPPKVDPKPLVDFLARDDHDHWRYLTLGLGDQMAWLSAQTSATTVDGNYHSVRRLPELTSRAVERLENSKFMGVPGLGSLSQFVTMPEKYHIKFIFSNDKFYDPLLFFSGWQRIGRLPNGMLIWERNDIAPLPETLPRNEIPKYQKLMWGILPITSLALALIAIALQWFSDRRRQPLVLQLLAMREERRQSLRPGPGSQRLDSLPSPTGTLRR